MMRTAQDIAREWQTHPRWRGVRRTYTAEDVVRLRGTVQVEYTLARLGAEHAVEGGVGEAGDPGAVGHGHQHVGGAVEALHVGVTGRSGVHEQERAARAGERERAYEA